MINENRERVSNLLKNFRANDDYIVYLTRQPLEELRSDTRALKAIFIDESLAQWEKIIEQVQKQIRPAGDTLRMRKNEENEPFLSDVLRDNRNAIATIRNLAKGEDGLNWTRSIPSGGAKKKDNYFRRLKEGLQEAPAEKALNQGNRDLFRLIGKLRSRTDINVGDDVLDSLTEIKDIGSLLNATSIALVTRSIEQQDSPPPITFGLHLAGAEPTGERAAPRPPIAPRERPVRPAPNDAGNMVIKFDPPRR